MTDQLPGSQQGGTLTSADCDPMPPEVVAQVLLTARRRRELHILIATLADTALPQALELLLELVQRGQGKETP